MIFCVKYRRKVLTVEISIRLKDIIVGVSKDFQVKIIEQETDKNHRLAKSISDASWYQIQMFTNYKAEWAGKTVIFVDPKKTSKECHICGNLEDMKLSDRTFRCSKCGLILDRDINAAINIKNRGIKELLINKKIVTPGTGDRACLSSPNRDTMIQEAPAFRTRQVASALKHNSQLTLIARRE